MKKWGKVNASESYDISQNQEKVSGQHNVTARTNEMLKSQIFNIPVFRPAQSSGKRTNCKKSVDAWNDELSPYKTLITNRKTTNQVLTMAWLLQQILLRI